MFTNNNGQRRGQRTTTRTVFNVLNAVALAGCSLAVLNSGGGTTLVVSAARMAPSNLGDDLPAGGKGGYGGYEYEEEGLMSVIGVDDEALTIPRRSRSLLSPKTHWHGQSFSVKDHVGDRINRWKGGSAAEQAGIAKRPLARTRTGTSRIKNPRTHYTAPHKCPNKKPGRKCIDKTRSLDTNRFPERTMEPSENENAETRSPNTPCRTKTKTRSKN